MEMVLVVLGLLFKFVLGTIILVVGTGILYHLIFDEDDPEVLDKMEEDRTI